MSTIPTFQFVYDAVRAEIQSRNPNLSDFQAGSVLDAYTGGVTIAADEAMLYAASRFDALFISRARGADLDALILDRLNLPRLGAVGSSGFISIARDPSYPTGAITIPANHPVTVTRVDGTTVSATLMRAVNIPSGAGPWVEITSIASTTTGRGTNTDATATYVLTTAAGTSLPTVGSILITVPAGGGLAGGADIERDAEYRARAIDYYGSLTRGTGAALVIGAKTVPSVRYAVYQERIEPGDVLVNTYLYVADADGNSNALMTADVYAALAEWRAAGRAVIVQGATIQYVPMVITIRVRAGVSQSLIDQAVRGNIISAVNDLSPSQTLYLSGLETIVHQTSAAVAAADIVVSGNPAIREVSGSTPDRILRVRDTDITTIITFV